MNSERFLRVNDNGGEVFSHTGTIGSSSSPPRSVPNLSPPSEEVNGGASYILHTVSKFDTLAGIAIKYGVEVADIKKLNGLMTDLQMFALKTIQIPLPARHPPSSSLSNGNIPSRPRSSQQTASSQRCSDLFDLFPSLKLKSSSQQVSGITTTSQTHHIHNHNPALPKGAAAEGFEMVQNHGDEAEVLSQVADNGRLGKLTENMVRRRQKSEVDFTPQTPEKILKEANTKSNSIKSINGKSWPESAICDVSESLAEGGPKTIPIGFGDSLRPAFEARCSSAVKHNHHQQPDARSIEANEQKKQGSC
ncbi:uncharacterized protein LOC127264240 isoform X2 [Andrographis paniculata]|uniref:uncharacterized protein LOC127264240 isoform X2 n=1 Tax=Andrographis paniculata TaxID=175694 RepID=UPI0021E8FB1D|nr:uncharacterized protein LOC127264240 isoform X2 [Andrographis paniculata]XP_051149664.1 uncharacterized protein LOC127264240 isoform X2 [Andrographis paniculata]